MRQSNPLLNPRKFRDPHITAEGQKRAVVALTHLRTLWFNTGSLCNLTCVGCYIESSPKNDRLAYLSAPEVRGFLDEIAGDGHPVKEIGFTGGEPFMNPQFCEMLEATLERGFRTLVLTNAMKPMMKVAPALLDLHRRYGEALCLRVSIDHYDPKLHDRLRGRHSWARMQDGLKFLVDNGFHISIAGRAHWDEPDSELRRGYARLFARCNISVDAHDPASLVIFPEMDESQDVPEITVACWDILSVKPESLMCATQRMVIKRKGADAPVVVPCTLLPYQEDFEMGGTLAAAVGTVNLNHPHCARFCVLGGGSCRA